MPRRDITIVGLDPFLQFLDFAAEVGDGGSRRRRFAEDDAHFSRLEGTTPNGQHKRVAFGETGEKRVGARVVDGTVDGDAKKFAGFEGGQGARPRRGPIASWVHLDQARTAGNSTQQRITRAVLRFL